MGVDFSHHLWSYKGGQKTHECGSEGRRSFEDPSDEIEDLIPQLEKQGLEVLEIENSDFSWKVYHSVNGEQIFYGIGGEDTPNFIASIGQNLVMLNRFEYNLDERPELFQISDDKYNYPSDNKSFYRIARTRFEHFDEDDFENFIKYYSYNFKEVIKEEYLNQFLDLLNSRNLENTLLIQEMLLGSPETYLK